MMSYQNRSTPQLSDAVQINSNCWILIVKSAVRNPYMSVIQHTGQIITVLREKGRKWQKKKQLMVRKEEHAFS